MCCFNVCFALINVCFGERPNDCLVNSLKPVGKHKRDKILASLPGYYFLYPAQSRVSQARGINLERLLALCNSLYLTKEETIVMMDRLACEDEKKASGESEELDKKNETLDKKSNFERAGEDC